VARLADRVIVLQGGVIVEEGPHDRLVARDGVYAALFAAQAQWYRAPRPRASAPGSR
jgi:ABC-type multidrug transport system fused ATPase/permease subunit